MDFMLLLMDFPASIGEFPTFIDGFSHFILREQLKKMSFDVSIWFKI